MQVVLVIDMTGQFVDLDVQYIALCILMANVLLNPLLHSAIRRPVRKALLVLARWLLYITFGCRSSLHPKTQIGIQNNPFSHQVQCSPPIQLHYIIYSVHVCIYY